MPAQTGPLPTPPAEPTGLQQQGCHVHRSRSSASSCYVRNSSDGPSPSESDIRLAFARSLRARVRRGYARHAITFKLVIISHPNLFKPSPIFRSLARKALPLLPGLLPPPHPASGLPGPSECSSRGEDCSPSLRETTWDGMRRSWAGSPVDNHQRISASHD